MMDDTQRARELVGKLKANVGHTADCPGCKRDVEIALAALAQERRDVLEEAATVVETYRPGNTVDMFTGHLIRDESGPWGLASEFAQEIRERARGV